MKYLTLLLFTVLFTEGKAQLIVDSTESQYLPAYDFFGPDYTVSNVTYVGHWKSFGQFDGTNSNLGLNRGFFLTTGDREFAKGPNTEPNSGFQSGINGESPYLDMISNQDRYDGATISFDITPNVDSLYFRFVFASEEYMQYIGSQFGDEMGIFIEGPGYTNPTNIGTLPGGEEVNINTVHSAWTNQYGTHSPQNEQYFVENLSDPNDLDETRIGYDGFTQGTFVKLQNIPIDSTYTITISIADVADGLYDSAIFVESCETCNYTLNADALDIPDFAVFPNPVTSNTLRVRSEGQHSFTIVDIMGHVVKTGNFQHEKDVDVSMLSEGTYILSLENGAVQKIIKQ